MALLQGESCPVKYFSVEFGHNHSSDVAGGASADPRLNNELGKAVKEARVVNMPMETVNRVIAKLDVSMTNLDCNIYTYANCESIFCNLDSQIHFSFSVYKEKSNTHPVPLQRPQPCININKCSN